MRTTSGHFDFMGDFMTSDNSDLKELQEPIEVDAQILNLIFKNLIIDDIESATAFLNKVSYFRFVKAYSLGLKPRNGNYYDGVSFTQISEIYEFNKRLRQIIFPLAEHVEVRLRCAVSNCFSCKHGNLSYRDPQYFISKDYHAEIIKDIDSEIGRNWNNPFVKNFERNYKDGSIPLYAAIELFSFGMLSKFYSNILNEDKKAIAKEYFSVGYTYLESWLESISSVRNICAHYGRLYNVKLVKQPLLYKQYDEIHNYRIFAVLLCFKHLVNDKMLWQTFVAELGGIIDKYSSSINLEYIGFPETWREMLEE